jgi:hypothetical protein
MEPITYTEDALAAQREFSEGGMPINGCIEGKGNMDRLEEIQMIAVVWTCVRNV